MKRSTIIIAVIAGVLLVGAGWLIAKNITSKSEPASTSGSDSSSSNNSSSSNSGSDSASTDNTDKPATVAITYSSSGFSPNEMTIKAGTTILIRNNSSDTLEFSSDPHPSHTDDPELNASAIAPGKTTTIKVTTTGTHGYHNHLNSADTGTLTVNE